MHNIFRDNPDFYPTPPEVLEKMLLNETVGGKVILEPSAGKGDISARLMELGARVLVCENDPNNIKLLEGKYDEFLAEDFLTVTREQVSHVDMIIMNPPFSDAERHILHAWEIAPAGCTVIALCNSNSLSHNGHMKSDREVFIGTVEDNGYSQFLGSCFDSAERQTGVYVSLVKLYKEGAGADEFDGYMFDLTDDSQAGDGKTAGLVPYNIVRELVNRYTAAVGLFDEAMAMAEKINSTADFKVPGRQYGPAIPISFRAVRNDDNRAGAVTHAYYKKELKKHYWKLAFDVLGMDRYNTSILQEQMNRFVETQQHVPFTMKNIFRVADMVVQTHGQRMQMAIENAFDIICSLSAQNSTAGEKWKTNSDYMVNRKFIVDYVGDYDPACYWRNETVSVHADGNVQRLDDISNALCFLTGRDTAEIDSLYHHCRDNAFDWGKVFEWGFFRVKVYKKGTAHLEFIDENVWTLFNRTVAQARGWQIGSFAGCGKRHGAA